MLHILSPFIYILFVKLLLILPPCPKSHIMITLRKYHNIVLSTLSFLMFIGIVLANLLSGKLHNTRSLLCKPYNYNIFSIITTKTFLYSKYLEWGDTVFIHLSGKPISQLQYTHHLTTAFLMYMNMVDYLSPHLFVFISLNCLVHTWMYWYFAYPKGLLYRYRKMITISQIIQHIVCLLTIIYTSTLKNCHQNKYGNICGFCMYMMYLFYFVLFYKKMYK